MKARSQIGAAFALLIASGAVAQAARDMAHPTTAAELLAAESPKPVSAAAAAAAAGPAAAGCKAKRAAALLPKNLVALSIAQPDGAETLGVKTPAGVVDVRAAAKALGMPAPLTLEEMLRAGSAAQLAALVDAAVSKKVALLDEASIKHGRLFTSPGKIVCVGLNYKRHAEEVGAEPPRVPPLFNKYNNALTGHGAVVKLPTHDIAYKIDYETELLIVIGAAARNVSEADALNYVAGYAVGHDLSARDLQLELPSGQWMIGKTLDGFAPIGPYFVSGDVVGDPNNLKLETKVNGKVEQEWTTSDFIFDVEKVVSYISKHWTLEPGDIIFTGTPQGVILGKAKNEQVWLKAGDVITSKIEKLGELKFTLA
ncbi:5-oxopent-3-ene-1,2,5-tricarboxylate decarboxylase [Raphidocelis subcapitata]|uniref:5-oxopent-3-ene-1,2,5-tricarboxylate decarboxylase n=1 Tax=Raphidocelis subcapitata TaxID=307507 RepID=A0A2V0NWL9_9CHLO|nr:5-oxopent-3-ene-1,2,5-tricarboxylate decarboxylase [Raphidocelis subcapitata]|eukprot:GBF92038.1 5-oxopent-3-ene-1,2,5-tricarboxylate decarboxylase [Raphidocelis subcapitata]